MDSSSAQSSAAGRLLESSNGIAVVCATCARSVPIMSLLSARLGRARRVGCLVVFPATQRGVLALRVAPAFVLGGLHLQRFRIGSRRRVLRGLVDATGLGEFARRVVVLLRRCVVAFAVNVLLRLLAGVFRAVLRPARPLSLFRLLLAH